MVRVGYCSVWRMSRTDRESFTSIGNVPLIPLVPIEALMAYWRATLRRSADQLINRCHPEAPDRLWVADITYVRSWEG